MTTETYRENTRAVPLDAHEQALVEDPPLHEPNIGTAFLLGMFMGFPFFTLLGYWLFW